jgi:hypothetical protein
MKNQAVLNKLNSLIPHKLEISASLRNCIWYCLGAFAGFYLCHILQIDLILPLFLLLIVIYLKVLYRDINQATYKLINLAFLFVLIFVASYIMLQQGVPVFYIPFCAVPMLATILFNELIVSLLLTAATALTVAIVAGNNFYLGILFLISGMSSSLLVCGARKRVTILRAGFIVGIVQLVSLFFIDNFYFFDSKRYIILFLNGFSCGIIVLGILPIFEYLFGTITNISLLELADFNHPLLNRLMLEAPGTYHHSLIVGNLSEAACTVVGANALLARIGAYYHDVGKLQKPEYFSENQSLTGNKHDTLSPSMSKLVIMNHVKDGVEMAQKYRLNPRLIDFILSHHGNSLVYYFYRRALENVEEDQEVAQEGFRYPGPKPNTKEIAIVMLADSVEAAMRTLKDPAIETIKDMVHKIINNKFIDGQFDECDLTLKDLEKIASVFIRILSGIYHTRINYPDEKQEPRT